MGGNTVVLCRAKPRAVSKQKKEQRFRSANRQRWSGLVFQTGTEPPAFQWKWNGKRVSEEEKSREERRGGMWESVDCLRCEEQN